jgi:steroid delta-isomerase-like uncharacterized protein
MTTLEARALFDSYWAAFTTRDLDALASLYTLNSYFEDVALKYVGHGPKQVRHYWETFNRAIPEWSAERHDLVVDGRGISFNYTFRGRLDGTLGPLVGSGHDFELRFGVMAQVEDGVITEQRQYWNLAGLLYDLGERRVPLIIAGAPLA